MNDDKKKIRILMVDDDREFLEPSVQTLSRRGFKVDIAYDGYAALEMLGLQDFEVVVLDVKMPGIDGIEVFSKIQEKWPGLPVILLTGHGTVSQAFQTSKAGIYDYLAKPCDMDLLAEKLHKAALTAKYPKDVISSKEMESDSTELIRVLIVDDEVQLLESLKTVLSRRRMKVTTAQNGEEGLELLKETPIDVVVLDIKLPGMDGLEVLRRIRRDFPDVEIILLTGHPSVDTAMEGMKLGASEYIVKPPKIENLATVINQAYSRRQENITQQQKKMIDDIRRRFPE